MRLCSLLTVSILLGTVGIRAVDLPGTKSLESKHYRILHDTADDEAAELGDHLDMVYDCLASSMAGLTEAVPAVRLDAALFNTRREYIDYLAGLGMECGNTNGIFISNAQGEGLLLTFLDSTSVIGTQRTLQHEATHQYLHMALHLSPPQWLDEGLATYYEDGCLVDGHLWTGLADVEKLDYLKTDLAKGLTMDVSWFFHCTNDQWNRLMERDPVNGQRLYDRSWSFIFYMLHGERGVHRRQFWEFVRLAAVRPDNCEAAFLSVFKVYTADFWRRRWEQWLRDVKPDAISATLQRAEHLARALRMLQLKQVVPSLDLRDVPEQLCRIGYHETYKRGGHLVSFAADDTRLYLYPGSDGQDYPFVLTASDCPGLPPAVKAPMLNPQPMAWWATGKDGAIKLHVTLAKLAATE